MMLGLVLYHPSMSKSIGVGPDVCNRYPRCMWHLKNINLEDFLSDLYFIPCEYAVVVFPEEEINGTLAMAVISTNWIFTKNCNLYCHWPNYFKSDAQKNKAVQQHASLILSKCVDCPIMVKYTSDNYEKTVAKLKYLEEHSAASSSDDYQSQRPRKKRTFSDYEENSLSEDENYVPRPPRVPKKISSLSACKNPFAAAATTPLSSRTLTPTNSIVERSSCTGCEANQALIRELMATCETISRNVNYLIVSNQQRSEPHEVFSDNWQSLESADDLVKLNQNLEDKENFSKVLSSFQIVGGKDFMETTRKILHKLMTHELSLKLNWTGRNDKISFKNFTNVINLIYVAAVAVRKNSNSSSATLADVENVTKAWLRNAPDREGGRAKRK
ncbi:hypothetical protein FQR65_LT16000 [Abscondita terminalis]|nr:hypothetical protein FQR65_LT16000 [Abscondita terminalis]